MVEIRNVGTAAASIASNTAALQTAMNTALTQETWIVGGANAQFEVAGFRNNITSFPLTFTAADRNNPPVMTEGWRLCGGDDEGWFASLTGSTATTLQDITWDGWQFLPRRITVVTPGVGTLVAGGVAGNYTIRDLPRAPAGLAWRIDPTFHGYTAGTGNMNGYGAGEAFMKAFTGFSGTRNILIQNCTFRGYGRAIQIGGANGYTFRNNRVIDWHEDFHFIGGGTRSQNVTIEFNEWFQSASISYRDAHYGWGYGAQPVPPGQKPPHPDANQTYGPTSGLLFQFNHMEDLAPGESHFFLHKLNDASAANLANYHTGTRIRNNFSNQSGSTTIWVSHTNGAIIENNKILKAGGTNSVIFQVYADTNPNAIVRNNYAPRQFTDGNANWDENTNNRESTDPNELPPAWVEFRRGHANLVPGAPFAGPYGGSGVTPSNPAGLTAGQVFFRALVQDPAFPDARRTFTINIPSTSPAANCNAMFWSSDADTTLRPMTQLADDGLNEVWQAQPAFIGGVGHLRSPNGSFVNVVLYYRVTVSSLLSLASSYTFTETVSDEGNPDPILSSIVNLDQTRRIATDQGDACGMVSTEFGTVWRLPE